MSRSGGRPRGNGVDDAILEATIRLLRVRGYSGLRVEDIAAVTGHAKTTIYRRWPSLRHLVLAALERSVGPVPDPGGDDVGNIKMVLLERFRALDAASLLGVALDLLRHEDAELRREYRERIIDPVRDRVIALLRKAFDGSPAVANTDPALLADALIGGLVYRAVVLGVPVSEHQIDEFVAVTLATGDHLA